MNVASSEQERILQETAAAKESAKALLTRLLDAKAQSERHLADLHQADAMKRLTGRSSIENAIASAQRMIETLDRSVRQLRIGLDPADAAVLEEACRR